MAPSSNDSASHRDAPAGASAYRELQPSPTHLLDSRGRYVAGWYEAFDGALNLDAARPRAGRVQSWGHLAFDLPEFFVGANIAQLGLGANVSLLVVDKLTQQVTHRAKTMMLWRNKVRVDGKFESFEDPQTGSFMRFDAQGGVEFKVQVKELVLSGQAEALFDRPFVQVTGYDGGRGTLQWWGNLAIASGELRLGHKVLELPKGTPGSYDRTLGHRRRQQNWNWLSTVGRARPSDRHEDASAEVSFALQMALDRAQARPRVAGLKFAAWLDGRLFKLAGLNIDYALRDPATRATGPWRITTPDGAGLPAIDATFTPRFQRREKAGVPFVYKADFNQYYGDLSGEIRLEDGRRYRFDEVFTLVEDSFLRL